MPGARGLDPGQKGGKGGGWLDPVGSMGRASLGQYAGWVDRLRLAVFYYLYIQFTYARNQPRPVLVERHYCANFIVRATRLLSFLPRLDHVTCLSLNLGALC